MTSIPSQSKLVYWYFLRYLYAMGETALGSPARISVAVSSSDTGTRPSSSSEGCPHFHTSLFNILHLSLFFVSFFIVFSCCRTVFLWLDLLIHQVWRTPKEGNCCGTVETVTVLRRVFSSCYTGSLPSTLWIIIVPLRCRKKTTDFSYS